jgi:hypothetical protein
MILYGGEIGVVKENDSNVYELDLDKVEWSRRDTASQTVHISSGQPLFPLPRAYHAACATTSGKPYVFVFGGYNAAIDQPMGDLWRYDVEARTWRLLVSFTYPKEEEGKDDVKKDAKADAQKPVKKLPTQPAPRYGHLMCMSPTNDALFVIGGVGTGEVPFKDIWRYDLKTKHWEQMTFDCISEVDKPTQVPLYIPAQGGAAVMFGHSILMLGGETLMDDVEPVLKDLLIYNTKTRQLIKCNIGDKNTAVTYHGLAYCNGQLLIVGGKYGWLSYNSDVLSLHLLSEPKVSKYLLHPSFTVVGIDIATLMTREENSKEKYPTAFKKCIEYLLEKGLDIEGIFRVSPHTAELDAMRLRFEQGVPVSHVDLTKYPNTHCIAALLKMLLRELPTSLIPQDLLPQVLAVYSKDANKKDDAAVKEIQAVIDKLPAPNKALLFALLDLFGKIIEHENMSKMNAEALARTAGYNFIQIPEDKEKELVQLPDNPVVKFVRTMIEQQAKLKQ